MCWFKDARSRAMWAAIARRSFMRFDFSHQTKEPNCTFCGMPIRKGAEVYYNKGTYHPGCAVSVAQGNKENKIASTEPTIRQR